MATQVDIAPVKLAKYLQIAVNQRKRALAKFVTDYGPESATVAECNTEISELELAIHSMIKAASKEPHSSTPRNK